MVSEPDVNAKKRRSEVSQFEIEAEKIQTNFQPFWFPLQTFVAEERNSSRHRTEEGRRKRAKPKQKKVARGREEKNNKVASISSSSRALLSRQKRKRIVAEVFTKPQKAKIAFPPLSFAPLWLFRRPPPFIRASLQSGKIYKKALATFFAFVVSRIYSFALAFMLALTHIATFAALLFIIKRNKLPSNSCAGKNAKFKSCTSICNAF